MKHIRMKGRYHLLKLSWLLLLIAAPALASKPNDPLKEEIRKEIAKLYPNTEIELKGSIDWISGAPSATPGTPVLLNEGVSNAAYFSIGTKHMPSYAEGRVKFSAWLSARIAIRRILPLEPLKSELFHKQNIDVSTGQAHELRGLIITDSADLSNMEAVQTIIEGQPLVATAIRRVPDIRRGESVKIELKSQGMTLSTLGIAEEPAYINRQVRVMTLKNKRELLGRLQPGGVVEVNL
jgi:flagella basal body P-ring formation protein FlgA